MTQKIYIGLLCLIFILVGCSTPSPSPTPTVPPTATRAPLTPEMVMNAEYQLNAANAVRLVRLQNGVYEAGTGPDFQSVHVADRPVLGDLNRDGLEDVAAVVGENYGGSGVFTYLAVFMNREGELLHQFSTLIDDRPQIQGIKIEDDKIILDAVVHSADDPMCCPSFPVRRTYQLTKSGLTLVSQTSTTPTGAERVITITSPKNGDQVSGSVQVTGNVTIGPFENNLVYTIYDAMGKELARGPFPVSSDGLGGPGTFDHTIDLSQIPPGLIIRIMLSDLSAADGSMLAMDSVEVLVSE